MLKIQILRCRHQLFPSLIHSLDNVYLIYPRQKVWNSFDQTSCKSNCITYKLKVAVLLYLCQQHLYVNRASAACEQCNIFIPPMSMSEECENDLRHKRSHMNTPRTIIKL